MHGLMQESQCFYESKVLTVRSYKELNEKELQTDLDMTPWHVSGIFDSIDDQHYYWNTLLSSIINDHAPLRKMRFCAVDVPYMTLEWKKAIRKNGRHVKGYARNPTEENRELIKKWRNNATRLRRRAIIEHWSKKADDLKTNPKNFYSVFTSKVSLNGINVRSRNTLPNTFLQ